MGKPTKGASADGAGGKKQERRKRKHVLDACGSGLEEDVGEETDGRGLKTGEKGGVTGDGVGEKVVEVKASKQRRQSDGDGHVGAKKKKKKMTMGDAEATNKEGTVEEMDRQDLDGGGKDDKGVEGGGPKESIIVRKVRKQRREIAGDDNVALKKKKKKNNNKKMGGEEESVAKKEDGNEEGKLARRMNRKSQEQEADMQGDMDKSMGATVASPANNEAEGAVQKDSHAGVLVNEKAGDEEETAADAAAHSDGAIVSAKRKHRKPRPADFLPLDVKSGDGQVAKNTKKKKRKGISEDSALIPYDNKPRVIFLSRVPHGFYEDQMLHFFGQFGTVTRLILSRNKKSGASRHYAFIEFQSAEVAAIVADCLHNYLIDGKILQCKLVPPEKVHPKTFLRADRVFKPWLGKKRHKALHDRVRDPEKAALLVARLRKRDNKRRAKLKVMGIEYDFQGYASLAPPKPKHVKFAADDEQTAQ